MLLSLSTHLFVYSQLSRDIFILIRENGFRNIETWGMPPHFPLGNIPGIKSLSEVLDDLGITIQSVHGPFYRSVPHALAGEWLSLCDPAPQKRREAHDLILLAMEAMNILHSRVLVIHSGLPEKKKRKGQELLQENLMKLATLAEKNEIMLALENGPESSSGVATTVAVVEEIHSPALGICLDIGHANVEPGMNPLRAIQLSGPHLVNLHVSDNYGLADEHNVPGAGTIQWGQIIEQIIKIQPERSCPESLLFTYELIDPGRGYPRNFERFVPMLSEISNFSNHYLEKKV